MSAPLADAEARRRIRDDLDTTFVVEAAAGTGKTSALVERVLSVLRSGRGTLRSVVAVTFTEKAAGEMKLRLRAEIERARNDTRASPIERDRLDASLEELETARIGTIHSFCADLLHERPLEAGVDPLFEVAAQDESDALFEATFDRWFERIVADPPPGIARILRRRPRSSQASGPREELLAAGLRSIEHRDFPAPWRTEPFDREGAAIELVARLRALAAYAGRADYPDDKLGENFAEIARFVRELDHREKVRGRDIDGLEAELRELARHWTWKMSGRRKRYGEGLSRDVVVAERDETKALLATFLARAGAHLAGLLSSELAPLAAEYAQIMEREGKLDFLDLLLRARDLLRGRDDIRAELARRFTHVFVDEQQDTDPLQAEILLLLCADDPAERDWTRVRPKPGKLFLVGDPKQSIYRFRRADIALYEATKARLLARGAELLHLSSSFRATPSLQSLVNASFEPVMRADASLAQPGYVPLGPVRSDPVGQPSIVALSVPRPYGGYGKVTNKAIDDSLPGAVAAFVEWMVRESGWTVTERDANERVPVGPRHICLLFKRFSAYGGDTTREYVRALEARRIPHVLVGGRSFHDREEVIAVRNLLTAVEWPDDELAVFATLRGPFLALSDEELLVFRHVHATLHPLAPIDPAKLDPTTAPVATALALLRTLHVGRNRRPIAETLELFLSSVRAHAGVAIWPTGEQALANVLRLLDLARRFETRGTTSFRAFVEKIERDSELGEAAEAPVVEEGTEGVRIMTVHKAKGLELPVVILCDPTAARAHDRPSRWIEPERGLWVESLAGCVPVELEEHAREIRQQDEAEAIRVAYVAATRARDLLVVPVVGDERVAGWFDVLHPAVYPIAQHRRAAEIAPGCPPFGDDSVLTRSGFDRDTSDSVAPGLHRPEHGVHSVVFWDPAVLALDRPSEAGLRQERLLVAEEQGNLVGAKHDTSHAWERRRRDALSTGSVPTFVARSTTSLVHAEPSTTSTSPSPPPLPRVRDVAIENVARRVEARAHGKRFGTLVHEVLARVDLDARPETVGGLVEIVGRIVGASAQEAAHAEETVRNALAHPLLRRAAITATSGSLRRETPLSLVLADGTIAEGIVDLAFREERDGVARWLVVDFKTDRDQETRLDAYRQQVSLYAAAIESATGEPCDAALLFV